MKRKSPKTALEELEPIEKDDDVLHPTGSGTLVDMVIHRIKQRIDTKEFRNGDKLPTNRELAAKLGVSILTIQRTMKHLEALGVVSCRRRQGTFLVNSRLIQSPRIQSDLIGLFFPDLFQDFHLDMLLEMERCLTQSGKLLSINFTHSDPEKELHLLRVLVRQRLETLVYFTSPRISGSERLSREVGAWINRYLNEGTWIVFADLCPNGFEDRLVGLDNEATGRLLAKELLKRGHRNVAFIGHTHNISGRERCEGCQAVLREAGLRVSQEHVLSTTFEDYTLHERIAEYILRYPDTTGFVADCFHSSDALRRAFETLPGERRPLSESLAGIFEQNAPPFEAAAWVQVPGGAMARAIVDLMSQATSSDYVPGRVKIPPVLWQE